MEEGVEENQIDLGLGGVADFGEDIKGDKTSKTKCCGLVEIG